MEKAHRKIEFMAGGSIESAIKELNCYKDMGELVYGTFNDQKLYSDVDDLESAYKKITGKTKEEYDAEAKEWNDKYDKEKTAHQNAIPQLTKDFIEKGKNILDEKYHEYWQKIVPIRLNDLYRGMELAATLEIVKELNAGCTLESAKAIIERQGHSGMSFGLVCQMVRVFCDRGMEFIQYLK